MVRRATFLTTALSIGMMASGAEFERAEAAGWSPNTSLPPPPPVAVEARPAPRPPALGPLAPRPKGQRGWMARILEAYPDEASRERWEGTLGLTVTVAPDGRATNCRITQSSDHVILDEAACTGMLRYSRFEPALDRQGEPTSGEFSTRITYRLP